MEVTSWRNLFEKLQGFFGGFDGVRDFRTRIARNDAFQELPDHWGVAASSGDPNPNPRCSPAAERGCLMEPKARILIVEDVFTSAGDYEPGAQQAAQAT
jgi:hypothetical protein